MLNFLKFGHRLDHDSMGRHALQEATSIATRWDVVQGQRKPNQDPSDPELYIQDENGAWVIWPHDLRDTRPRLYRTAPDPVTGKQGRVAGRILPDDLVGGSPSSAIPFLFAFVSVVSLALLMSSYVGLTWVAPALTLGVLLAVIASATGGAKWGFMSGLAALVPLTLHTGLLSEASAMGAASMGSTTTLIQVGGLIGLTLLFGGLRSARVTLGVALGFALTFFAAAHAPAFFQPFLLLLPACALPWAWTFALKRSRAIELTIYGTMCNWEDSNNGLGHIQARRAQTLRAAKEYTSCK